jgi:hypothetical protein
MDNSTTSTTLLILGLILAWFTLESVLVDGLAVGYIPLFLGGFILWWFIHDSKHTNRSAADLPFVAVGILEKNGVVARRVVVAVFLPRVRAGLADNRARRSTFSSLSARKAMRLALPRWSGFSFSAMNGTILRSPSA